jgi:benzil reductase ((S)-benzoin forming)
MRVYITGVSGGLGKALAHEFLKRGNIVVGIGRNSSIVHPDYSFLNCDLTNLQAITKIRFQGNEEGCILINNAGLVGPIKRISDQHPKDVTDVMNVNIIAPMLLCQQFLQQLSSQTRKIILNISSGAANRPIPSWATYCASKIALDRFSETILLEEQEKGREMVIYSVAPGVVNTNMQSQIRSASQNDFSSISKFSELYLRNQLQDPEEVAQRLADLLFRPFDGQVVRSIATV